MDSGSRLKRHQMWTRFMTVGYRGDIERHCDMALTFTRGGRLPSLFDLEFIKEDVQAQRRIARELLEQARRVQRVLDENPNMENKKELEEFRDGFLESAENLAKNAGETSNTATLVITTAATAASS